jgi:hypothetical protein
VIHEPAHLSFVSNSSMVNLFTAWTVLTIMSAAMSTMVNHTTQLPFANHTVSTQKTARTRLATFDASVSKPYEHETSSCSRSITKGSKSD